MMTMVVVVVDDDDGKHIAFVWCWALFEVSYTN